MRIALLLLTLSSLSAQELKWDDRAALERFLFPTDETVLLETMKALFPMEKLGGIVTVATQAGPSYMSKAAGAVKDDAFRDSYTQLSQYVDRAGGCFRKAYAGKEGWWSNYPDVESSACDELIKLIAGRVLWNQIHYCRELLTTKAPDGRLDAPPVQSPFLKPEAAYALADALIRFGVADRPETRRLQKDLHSDPVKREFVAIEAAKAVLDYWEAMHQQHLDIKTQK